MADASPPKPEPMTRAGGRARAIMERSILGRATEGGKVVEIEDIEPGGDVFAFWVSGFLIAVEALALVDGGGGASVHEVGPSFDFLAASRMFLIFLDPAEDFSIARAASDLFFEGEGIDPCKFEEVLIEGAVVVVFAVFFEKSGATFVEDPWEEDIATEADPRAAGSLAGEVGGR